MNCPVCGSEIPSDVKYCPECGTDVEARLLQSQAWQAAAQQQAPRPIQRPYQQPYQQGYGQPIQQPIQKRGAVPMNSSMPQQLSAARSIDTNQLDERPPRWPIVLIALLIAIIVIAVVLIVLHPWQTPGQPVDDAGVASGPTSAVVSETAGTSQQATGAPQGATTTPDAAGQQTPAPVTDQQASQPAAPQYSEQAVYEQLSTLYNEMGGFDAGISAMAGTFNENYLSPDGAARTYYDQQANDLLLTLSECVNVLRAMEVPQTSPNYQSWSNILTCYECLWNRTSVIARAWDLSASVPDPGTVESQIIDVLSADNVNGVNRFKTQFQELSPFCAPVAP